MALLRKRAPEADAEPEVAMEVLPAGGKGRPTPKRNEARAARPRSQYSLSGPSGARGGNARATTKEQRRAQSAEYRAAMLSGDVTKLPPRERTPDKVLTRDIVDHRRNMGPYFLGVAGLWIVGGFIPVVVVHSVITWLFLAGLFVVIIDSVRLGRTVGRAVRAELNQHAGTTLRLYAVQRALLPARWRMPRPTG